MYFYCSLLNFTPPIYVNVGDTVTGTWVRWGEPHGSVVILVEGWVLMSGSFPAGFFVEHVQCGWLTSSCRIKWDRWSHFTQAQ